MHSLQRGCPFIWLALIGTPSSVFLLVTRILTQSFFLLIPIMSFLGFWAFQNTLLLLGRPFLLGWKEFTGMATSISGGMARECPQGVLGDACARCWEGNQRGLWESSRALSVSAICFAGVGGSYFDRRHASDLQHPEVAVPSGSRVFRSVERVPFQPPGRCEPCWRKCRSTWGRSSPGDGQWTAPASPPVSLPPHSR